MFQQIKSLCSKCPGCTLANRVTSPAKELTYGFPTTAPFMVFHIDGFSAGSAKNFDDDSTYLIRACGMTGFAVMESVCSPDATGLLKLSCVCCFVSAFVIPWFWTKPPVSWHLS